MEEPGLGGACGDWGCSSRLTGPVLGISGFRREQLTGWLTLRLIRYLSYKQGGSWRQMGAAEERCRQWGSLGRGKDEACHMCSVSADLLL